MNCNEKVIIFYIRRNSEIRRTDARPPLLYYPEALPGII